MIYRNFYTCCFTGHRPKGLPWGYDEDCDLCKKFKFQLEKSIEGAIQYGCNYFICGMALGFDMMCAEIVIKLKIKYPHIKIEAVLPCRNQSERWRDKDKEKYQLLLSMIDKTTCLNENYTPNCMNDRNRYMVDHSSVCIACWNGKPSGTYNTIKYAKEKGCKIKLIRI